jgi:Zn-dependent protease with chaperone function
VTEFSGELFDGTSTTPTVVGIRLAPEGLTLLIPDGGAPFIFKYHEVLEPEKTGRGFRCVLPRQMEKGPAAWVLGFNDQPLYLALKQHIAKTHGPAKRGLAILSGLQIWKLLVLSLICLGLVFTLLYTGLQYAYRLTPMSYDLHLGQKVDSTFSKFFQSCHTPELDTFFEKSLRRLALPSDHFPHRVIILNDPTENALALPGGTIYVYRGLLEKSTSPDELLGVISHEISHSELRHTVRQIIQSTGISYLMTLTIGMAIDGMDLLEGLESTLEMTSVLLTLRYSRGFESEADSLGIIRMHHAQLKVGPLDTLLTKLSPKPSPRSWIFALFSTHPLSQERSERFAVAQSQETFPSDTVFAMERKNWNAMKRSCPTPQDSLPLWKKFLE